MIKRQELIEPQACRLNIPSDEQLLYKIMTLENLFRSIAGNYLYFNRVDSYKDFTGADPHDGEQPPNEREANKQTYWESEPSHTLEQDYDNVRQRAYACCFSIQNTDYIWRNYGQGGKKGKVCLVFNFGKLRSTLNECILRSEIKKTNKSILSLFLAINPGLVKYFSWNEIESNKERPNLIEYIYMKDKRYENEQELRISLSDLSLRTYILNNGALLNFPKSIRLPFDFKKALCDGTIKEILCSGGSLFSTETLTKS